MQIVWDSASWSAGVQLAPSLRAQTQRLLEDRAHRRLLEQQDEHYLDFAGLASHRRANMNHRGRRGHKARERLMQAGKPQARVNTASAEERLCVGAVTGAVTKRSRGRSLGAK